MSALTDLLRDQREEWLNRILDRVGRAGYLGAVTSARMDWSEVLRGVEGVLRATEASTPPQVRQRTDPPAAGVAVEDPSAAMGIRLARQMRLRGVPLRFLVAITAIVREAALDVLLAHPEGQDIPGAHAVMIGSTDRMVLALCQEWTEGTDAGQEVRELAQAARVQAEEKTRYVGILESLGSPVFLLGTDNRVEYCNPAAWWMFSDRQEQGAIRGRPVADLAPEVAVALAAFEQSGEDEGALERRVQTRKGMRHVDVRMGRVRDVKRQVTGTVVVLNDVTQRREVEEALRQAQVRLEDRVRERTEELQRANESLRTEVRERRAAETVLRESEERYRTLVNLSPDGIIVHSDGLIVFANAAARKLLGLDRNDDSALGRPAIDFVHPDDRAVVSARLREMLAQASTAPAFEERFVRADGSVLDVEVSAAAILFEGHPSALVVFRDITDRLRQRREAEERTHAMKLLLDAQERASTAEPGTAGPVVASALAAAGGALRSVWFALGTEDRTLRFDSGFGIDGMEHTTALARELRFRVDEPDDVMAEVTGGREPVYLPDCRSDPRWRPLESWTSSALFLPVRFRDRIFGVCLLMSPLRDAFPTDRRERAVLAADYLGAALENALLHARTREAEHRFRSIFENAMEGLYQCTADGRLVTANPALARILGYESPADLLANPADFPLRLFADADRRTSFLDALTEHGFVQGFEHEVRRADGQRAWVSESARAIEDAGTAGSRWEGVVEDVSRRKELEQQLRQAQKMEAIGRLAGGVAHDFNNLLTAILGYSGILMDRLAPGDPNRRDVVEIREAGRRAATLTGQLLAFSRKQVMQPVVLDLNAVVTNLDDMLRRLIGEDIELVTQPGTSPVFVRADPGQLDQVLVNLAVNGRDAMPGGGRLTIEVGTLDVDGADRGGTLGLPPGRYALLTVADTGIGMDDRVRAHLFEPFFTTKGAGKGTGLGLAVVYGIVKQSGGYIWCESTPGEGACMRICLPRVPPADPCGSAHPEPAHDCPRGTETVLVAEDEAAVRGLIRIVLEGVGYRVIEARDGREALDIASRLNGTLHLLVSDIVMPGMNGRELAGSLRQVLPSVRVLFTSGYTDSVLVDTTNLGPGATFLQKPFSPGALLAAVRELLDSTL